LVGTWSPTSSWSCTTKDILLRIAGEIDLATIDSLRTALAGASKDLGCDVIVDFTAVSFFDSLTLGSLAVIEAHIRANGHTLTLRGLNAHQADIVRVCQLEEFLGIVAATTVTE